MGHISLVDVQNWGIGCKSWLVGCCGAYCAYPRDVSCHTFLVRVGLPFLLALCTHTTPGQDDDYTCKNPQTLPG